MIIPQTNSFTMPCIEEMDPFHEYLNRKNTQSHNNINDIDEDEDEYNLLKISAPLIQHAFESDNFHDVYKEINHFKNEYHRIPKTLRFDAFVL